jgi:DNA-binding CsgD family transcriptional regulator
MFISLIRGLLEKEIPGLFKKVFFIFGGIFFLWFIISSKNYFNTFEEIPSIFYALAIITIIPYITIIQIFIKAKELGDQKKQKSIKMFGLIYLLCFPCFYFVFLKTGNNFLFLYSPLLFFSLNLPPLLYLKAVLNKNLKEFSFLPDNREDIDHFFSKYNFSEREKEVIFLILNGKSNKEIEDELFISLQTVKNNIYKIFKKLKVKNRVQLTNLVRNSLTAK